MRAAVYAAVVAIATAGVAQATTFTRTSPTGEALPSAVSEVGGVVFDAIGINGNRLVTQASASSLFEGYASTNPLTIGVQTGFTPTVLGQLGGGFSEIAVRFTLTTVIRPLGTLMMATLRSC